MASPTLHLIVGKWASDKAVELLRWP